VIDADLESAIRKLLADCPLGARDDRVLMPRNLSEADLAAWIHRVYEVNDRIAKEAL
jgi:hypothetical protein